MILFMLAMALLAFFVGAVAFVTGPVGTLFGAVIAAWLVIYVGRGLLARRAAHRG